MERKRAAGPKKLHTQKRSDVMLERTRPLDPINRARSAGAGETDHDASALQAAPDAEYVRQFLAMAQRLERFKMLSANVVSGIVESIQKGGDTPVAAAGRFCSSYEVLACVGQGASGKVYKCRSKEDEQIYAIKVIKVRTATKSRDQDVALVFKEGEMLQRCEHPNIVKYFDMWKEEGEPGKSKVYIVMEFCGRSLQSVLLGGESPPADAFRQLLQAVAHVHDNVGVHRDIAPHNIFVTDDGRIKLGDFGLAKNKESMLETENIKKGRAVYYSPQRRSNSTYTDMLALGVILFELHWRCPPDQERESVLIDVRDGVLPADWAYQHPSIAPKVLELVAARRDQRPSARDILCDPAWQSVC
ncbi:eukaryotic translation initiation factor 2-alpha kinase-like isoform X1 [Selaginella moellendorffii]|uniref:eukaryotic translation initiation factor 2-alpha kinase-like isoform X1 n=1 Tax=Selaginella moellendorffii TaxID=88036 RepID=UPI000D1C737E|nr:eukaryotic translation initiation factor 2-alpha kinase-like isoform X1 [Selaginella moellendorffii]XP_024523578.1 eukaryotic translation initiation factor 2-alpha kinase-like isoform X1 [Selaginella moellendorffii]XP_024523579.1 eukaryotic translation initiation factor 2-alpha kinase-like isoform X1 [Selaginella moellendorffii]XP_024523580.1 eukaryotic translation initiation factor 2-alpha kinase-like isoform X1 [Selaginella moellendorffii]XP_024523708.1 eukaryotic translation initiation fa|eukprot:XP_024523577.1 eukaryotic translation initiation factor 2-alpha kinase-like isoform X1 [Selaginella moellendorffii]